MYVQDRVLSAYVKKLHGFCLRTCYNLCLMHTAQVRTQKFRLSTRKQVSNLKNSEQFRYDKKHSFWEKLMNTHSGILATLYFDTYRTYIALVESRAADVQLSYINATQSPLHLFEPLEDMLVQPAFHEVQSILRELRATLSERSTTLDGLAVSVDMDSVLAYQVPVSKYLSAPQLRRLLDFEIRQHTTCSSATSYQTLLHPLYHYQHGTAVHPEPQRTAHEESERAVFAEFDGAQSALAVFIHPELAALAEHCAAILGTEVQRIDAAQVDAHYAQQFNYPEEQYAITALCGVQGNIVDVSVVKDGRLAYFASVEIEHKSTLADVCKAQVETISTTLGRSVDALYCFGTDLTKQALNATVEALSLPVRRLNPFRRLSTTLSRREREYCSRVAHVLAPCVGSAVVQERWSVRF